LNVHLPPDAIVERLVAQYATGALGSGMNVLMACLLTMRPELRREYEQMTALQGAFLDDADQIEMSANSLEQILGQLSEEDVQPEAPTPADINADLPSPLRAILSNEIENIRWRFLYPGVRQARLKIGGRDEDIKLLKIKPGKAAPRHTHDGFEATLVLRGAFRDEGKLFVRGDVAIANGRVDHRPRAEGDEDCYCLAVTTGALRVTDNLKRVLRDFLN
jgi:putative transcriptional regulator